MRYTKPQVVATLSAIAVIQKQEDSGAKPGSGYVDQTFNQCSATGYDADE